MQVPVYNAQGKQIGYYTPDGRVYTYKGMRNDNLGYYFKNGKPVPGYKQATAPAGMPSNVQRGSSQNIAKQATTPVGMPTSAKQAQATQQNKEAVSKAHSDANYNAAVNAKEAQKKQQVQAAKAAANKTHSDANYNAAINAKEAQKKQQTHQTQPATSTANKGFLASANERIAQMTDVANTLASKPQAHQDYGYNAAEYTKEAQEVQKKADEATGMNKVALQAKADALKGLADSNMQAAQKESSRGIPTKEEREQQNEEIKPTVTAPVSTPAKPKEQEAVQQKVEEPVQQNNFNLAQYDKWADSRLKKKFQKMGKADQYQNFVNDFYGSGPMDDAKYSSIMKKYGLGDSMLNDFDIGKSNWKQNTEYVNNKVNKQANKQRNEAVNAINATKNESNNQEPVNNENNNQESTAKAKPDYNAMLKGADPEDIEAFKVGKGPIYDALMNIKY